VVGDNLEEVDLSCAKTITCFLHGPAKYSIDGEILLLPVHVRHVENARTWSQHRIFNVSSRHMYFFDTTFLTKKSNLIGIF